VTPTVTPFDVHISYPQPPKAGVNTQVPGSGGFYVWGNSAASRPLQTCAATYKDKDSNTVTVNGVVAMPAPCTWGVMIQNCYPGKNQAVTINLTDDMNNPGSASVTFDIVGY
jgi:hypothetical protein